MKRIWIKLGDASKRFKVSEKTLRRLQPSFENIIYKQRIYFVYWNLYTYFKLKNDIPNELYGDYEGVTFEFDKVGAPNIKHSSEGVHSSAFVCESVQNDYKDPRDSMTEERLFEYQNKTVLNCRTCDLEGFTANRTQDDLNEIFLKFDLINLNN